MNLKQTSDEQSVTKCSLVPSRDINQLSGILENMVKLNILCRDVERNDQAKAFLCSGEALD